MQSTEDRLCSPFLSAHVLSDRVAFSSAQECEPQLCPYCTCICITIIFCLYSGNVPITRLTCPIEYTQLGAVQGQLFFFFFYSDPAASGRCTPIVRFVKLDADLIVCTVFIYYIFIYLSYPNSQFNLFHSAFYPLSIYSLYSTLSITSL